MRGHASVSCGSGVLLRREGWQVNHKRVRRLYRLEGLQLRMRVRRRKHASLHRGPAPAPVRPTERWSMDFVQTRSPMAGHFGC